MSERESMRNDGEEGEVRAASLSPRDERPSGNRVEGVPGLGGVILSDDEMKELREQGRDNNP